MTNSTLPSVETQWVSEIDRASVVFAGVRFRIARLSFSRRVDLARRVRDLAQRIEFLDAGGSVQERLASAVLAHEIDRVYAEWGLLGVEGLTIDSEAATAVSLLERGPVALVAEIVAAIKQECGLSDEERKN